MSDVLDNKRVLDMTCGARVAWYDKHNPLAVFCDDTADNILPPDLVNDVTELGFDDEQFDLVLFDPSLVGGDYRFSRAEKIKRGFNEAMRVLKTGHVLVVKWEDVIYSDTELWATVNAYPLFGSCGRGGTGFAVFYKAAE